MANSAKSSNGAVVGLTATIGGLAAGNVIAAFVHGWHNPIVSIGNRVIDHVPSWLKTFAIRTFGVNDKTFLVVTIFIAVLALGYLIGKEFLAGNSRRALWIVIAMSAVASLASLFDAGANLFSTIPSIVSGFISFQILRFFKSYEDVTLEPGVEISRRDIFKAAGIVGLASVGATGIGRLFHQHASVQLARLKIILPKPLRALAAPPKDPALATPGLSKLFTPNEQFYRIDTALSIPNLSIDSWKLTIDGLVSNPIELTYKELTSRPVFELDDTIACVSNEVGGQLVGNARWLGIRLDDLIKEASPTSTADQIMGYSSDGFTAGFPLAVLDGRDAMIAIGMNGEALPVAHGFPARIIVPGLYGYVSATKWLTRIELTRFDQKQGYWIPRGWSTLGPIKTQSRIDTPFDGSDLPRSRQAIAGVAWAPTRGISHVEVRIDKEPWREATLGPELAKTTWRQWWIDWSPTSGRHSIAVRATDGTGAVQKSTRVAVDPNGAEGWHTIQVSVN
ncbi:MAG: molybdopterin-dependent oxidoreductase [Actinomycetota bacterium]